MQDTYILIGQRIKEYRKRIGYTQQQLAEVINCSTSFISRLETGSSMASVDNLLDIATALKVPVNAFFVDLGNDPNSCFSQNPRMASLMYRITTLSEKQLDYIIENIDLFISFCQQQ